MALTVDEVQMTVLHHAAHADNAELLDDLVKAGAKVTAVDKTRHSALAVAAMAPAEVCGTSFVSRKTFVSSPLV